MVLTKQNCLHAIDVDDLDHQSNTRVSHIMEHFFHVTMCDSHQRLSLTSFLQHVFQGLLCHVF